MCGVVGAFVLRDGKFTITEEYIEQMRDTMLHRGPDKAATWVAEDGRVGLGHRRLAIIDLSDAATQPMCNENRTLWVCFNGEIYNSGEIRQELGKLGGHHWKTDHSDTEVILHAFEEWGIACIHSFQGMFAIALWDVEKRELWLIRDRIGIKPLYYCIHNGRVTFASEIKALLQDPDQKRYVNEEAFYHYLSFLTTPAPNTLFGGIKKIPSGTWLCIREDGKIQENRYWDIWENTSPLTGVSEDEIAETVLAELQRAVELRKVSDVPLGVFLSGGIDSSINAALFSESENRAVRTFSIGYQGKYKSYQNELHYARKMADAIGAEYHERLLNVDDLLDFLPRMVQLQDEPIADPVCVPVHYVSKLARDNGVIVCQVGEGADELFCGYPSWLTSLRLQQYNKLSFPDFYKGLLLKGLKLAGAGDRSPYEWVRRGLLRQPIFWGGAEAFTDSAKQHLLSPRLRKVFSGFTSWEALKPIREHFEENAWDKSDLNWMSYLDLRFRLPELLLMRVDKMSMGVSLEARVPFLDHKVVELAMSIPWSIKIKNNTLKYILKKSVRGFIPDEIIDRRKQGFGVPVHEWFFGKLGERMQKELIGFCCETDFLDRKGIRQLVKQGNGRKVWYLFNFALWWKEYIA